MRSMLMTVAFAPRTASAPTQGCTDGDRHSRAGGLAQSLGRPLCFGLAALIWLGAGGVSAQEAQAPLVESVGVWAGGPTFGGAWIAHRDVETARDVAVSTAEGRRAEVRLLPLTESARAPGFLVSAEAAEALGMTPGAPMRLTLEELDGAEPVGAADEVPMQSEAAEAQAQPLEVATKAAAEGESKARADSELNAAGEVGPTAAGEETLDRRADDGSSDVGDAAAPDLAQSETAAVVSAPERAPAATTARPPLQPVAGPAAAPSAAPQAAPTPPGGPSAPHAAAAPPLRPDGGAPPRSPSPQAPPSAAPLRAALNLPHRACAPESFARGAPPAARPIASGAPIVSPRPPLRPVAAAPAPQVGGTDPA